MVRSPKMANVAGLGSSDLQLNALDSDGETPIHRSASAGYYEIVELLIDAGAIVSSQNPNDGVSA
jgi:ankyrin repeat protein